VSGSGSAESGEVQSHVGHKSCTEKVTASIAKSVTFGLSRCPRGCNRNNCRSAFRSLHVDDSACSRRRDVCIVPFQKEAGFMYTSMWSADGLYCEQHPHFAVLVLPACNIRWSHFLVLRCRPYISSYTPGLGFGKTGLRAKCCG
jgi:hypothetical protein